MLVGENFNTAAVSVTEKPHANNIKTPIYYFISPNTVTLQAYDDTFNNSMEEGHVLTCSELGLYVR